MQHRALPVIEKPRPVVEKVQERPLEAVLKPSTDHSHVRHPLGPEVMLGEGLAQARRGTRQTENDAQLVDSDANDAVDGLRLAVANLPREGGITFPPSLAVTRDEQ